MLKNQISLQAMILFSPAKINIGLQILERRMDGFHNIQSVLYPVGLCDILEINDFSDSNKDFLFKQSGIRFRSDEENNLCIKAWKLLSRETTLPPVEIHLHKQIPVGAGLGGGSSNASFTLKGLNVLARKPVSEQKLEELAAILGSDCPFFLHSGSMLMEGRGEILNPVRLEIEGLYLVLLFPKIHVSTAEAYDGVIPALPERFLSDILQEPVSQWRDLVANDFEKSVFKKYPLLKSIKQALYNSGAIYASLSGSGSSLYGLFREKPELPDKIQGHVIWKGPIITQPAVEF